MAAAHEAFPTRPSLEHAAAIADRVFGAFVDGGKMMDSAEDMVELGEQLTSALATDGGELARECGDCKALAQAAITYFLRNDLFT